MIPKIIHYAWFGGEKPEKVQKCIASWHRLMPDWEFMEWNEKNWDINQYAFAQEMYAEKNWGFLSDTLRFDVVYRYGGFYFDTDMLMTKPITDEFRDAQNMFCFMFDNALHTGLFGAEKETPVFAEILKMYHEEKYENVSSLIRVTTNNPIITKMLMILYPEFKLDNTKQVLGTSHNEVVIWPKEYFVYPSFNRKISYTEHLFTNSWSTANLGTWGMIKALSKLALGKTIYGKISAHRGKVKPHKGGVIIKEMK
ncbi:glycosyltransferase family 32 protein [Periweissella ghanensis]|uniref:Uncharacterized protein n=1 Tax=Periweissella ghanensis TaxID=467997 RepID=A0ABM8ZC47_9LACO|nr:glycosyltransferase [Periweissella ghanensis]MCM0600230.1 glycosyl transferase [Periweissella ghanensis]CAH0419138.1 hypothetical protein WGH24286_01585 [Periweissella ghanensis]